MPDASDRSTDHGLSPVGVGRLALHDVDCGLELIKAFPQIDAIHVRRSDNQLFQLHRAKMKLGDAGKKLFQIVLLVDEGAYPTTSNARTCKC